MFGNQSVECLEKLLQNDTAWKAKGKKKEERKKLKFSSSQLVETEVTLSANGSYRPLFLLKALK
jgi:hypothetical protein